MINDELHLAEMVSLMGPPPKEFLSRSPECSRYWDSEGEYFTRTSIPQKFDADLQAGNWIAKTPIPMQSLETRERQLEGPDKDLLLQLVRKILCWLPEERASASDVFSDDFILQHTKQDGTKRK
jgi:hypothetical protein